MADWPYPDRATPGPGRTGATRRGAKRPAPERCELCGRIKPLTFHHLIPRSLHKKRTVQARFDKTERVSRGLWICRLCHRQIHRLYSRRRLAEELNSREALVSEPEMEKFLSWARRQK